MRAVIICGGTITDYSFIKKLIKKDDMIICADSGYDHALNMELKTDIVIGDFDSIKTMPTGITAIHYPARKDETDSEIALTHARSMGYKDFLLIGASGSRLDHTLTNMLMLKECLDRGENAVMINENNKIMITNSFILLQEPSGSIVSLVPLTECIGVTTENLEYPLLNATLHVGKGIGISNVMTNSTATVSLIKGLMLIIIANDSPLEAPR